MTSPLVVLLALRLGMGPDSLGVGVAERIIRQRMAAVGVDSETAYAALLSASPGEWESLVDRLVVTETWFFRYPSSFAYLREVVAASDGAAFLRALSLPCATGEEPYSIAMTLLSAGLSPGRFAVDAVDVSRQALRHAASGRYGRQSFRGDPAMAPADCLETDGEDRLVAPLVRERVRFLQGNPLEEGFLAGQAPYHVIFCRNLLIYLLPEARRRLVAVISRLLIPDGLLFVGHAEHEPFRAAGFIRATPIPDVFALRPPSTAPAESAAGRIRRIDDGLQMAAAYLADYRLSAEQAAAGPFRPMAEAGEPSPAPSESGRAPTSLSGTSPATPDDLPETGAVPPRSADGECLDEARRLADEGRLDEAHAILTEQVRRYPGLTEAYFLLGLIHQAKGDEKTAESFLAKATYLNPRHHEALMQLAVLAEHRGDRRQADALRQRAARTRRKPVAP